MSDNKYICIDCGKIINHTFNSGRCEYGHNVVEQEPCYRCGRLIGSVSVDPYCGNEMLICPDCLDKVRC